MRNVRSAVKSKPWVRGPIFLLQNVVRAVPGSAIITDPAPQPTFRLTAMIRVKDEARFLPEWLAHHANLGFEHVYVYDNNSSDRIEDVIRPFVAAGLATYIAWPTVPASPSSNIDFLSRFGHECEWTAFFDADEFLVEAEDGDLARVLASTTAPAVAVNWRYYGSAGHVTIPDGLVTGRFDRADATHNRHVKVIARPAEIVAYRNSHNYYYQRGRLARTPGGRRVLGSFVAPDAEPVLTLHHYIYRSREDYLRKATHGFVDAGGAQQKGRQTHLADYEFDRHNAVHAPLPGDVLRRTADLLEKLGYSSVLWQSSASADDCQISAARADRRQRRR